MSRLIKGRRGSFITERGSFDKGKGEQFTYGEGVDSTGRGSRLIRKRE